MELDAEVRHKFDDVLARVKEPQSELSLAELNLVGKLSYFEADKTIIAYLNIKEQRLECYACAAVDGFMIETISRDLSAALLEEFPGWTIEVK